MRQATIYPAECIGIIAFDPNTYNESIFHPEMKDVLYMERKCYEKMIRENVKIEEKETHFRYNVCFAFSRKKQTIKNVPRNVLKPPRKLGNAIVAVFFVNFSTGKEIKGPNPKGVVFI